MLYVNLRFCVFIDMLSASRKALRWLLFLETRGIVHPRALQAAFFSQQVGGRPWLGSSGPHPGLHISLGGGGENFSKK